MELDCYFQSNPTARVTGIDLAEDMLRALREAGFSSAEVLAQWGAASTVKAVK